LNKAYSCIPDKSRILFFAPDTPKILFIRYKPAPHQKISQQTCDPKEIEVKGPKPAAARFRSKTSAPSPPNQPRAGMKKRRRPRWCLFSQLTS